MYSVFNVSPPSFTLPEISDILNIEFSINGTVTELYSDRDQNFHVHTGTDDFIVKVSNPAEDRSLLVLQDLLQIKQRKKLHTVHGRQLELLNKKLA